MSLSFPSKNFALQIGLAAAAVVASKPIDLSRFANPASVTAPASADKKSEKSFLDAQGITVSGHLDGGFASVVR